MIPFMIVKHVVIKSLFKKKFAILLMPVFVGPFVNSYADATINNSYKEVIDHVWQIVYRDFLIQVESLRNLIG